MGKRTVVYCDMCGNEMAEPRELIVSHPSAKAWQMDVCDSCYKEHYAWKGRKKAQPTSRVAGRPQARLQRTVLPPQPGSDGQKSQHDGASHPTERP